MNCIIKGIRTLSTFWDIWTPLPTLEGFVVLLQNQSLVSAEAFPGLPAYPSNPNASDIFELGWVFIFTLREFYQDMQWQTSRHFISYLLNLLRLTEKGSREMFNSSEVFCLSFSI